jgi:hypothetical protein
LIGAYRVLKQELPISGNKNVTYHII